MTLQMIICLTVVVGTFLTLLFTKTKAEIAFFSAMALLCITGVVNFEEAFSGFDSSGVLTVAVLYITIAGLKYSNALEWIVRHIMGQPKTHVRALLRLMLPVGVLSSAMSNTACTALFQDVVKIWAERLDIKPSKLLIPLAYAASLGGLMTLIGTPPNLIIANFYQQESGETLNVFATFPVAALIFIVCVCIVIVGRNLLPEREAEQKEDEIMTEMLDKRFSSRTFVSMGILVLLLVVSALDILPLTTCCLIAGMLMVITRCCTSEEAFREVDWRVLTVFAGSVCIGKAMANCGMDDMITHLIMRAGGDDPHIALLLICGVAAVMTECLSDTGCAAVFFPIAYSTAIHLGVSPVPFMIALMMSVSSSYATPIATPPNTIVYVTGGYKFSDYARLGIIMKIASLMISVFVTPLFFHF